MAAEVEEVAWMPIRSIFNIAAKISASFSSVGVRGATYAFSEPE